ncbi:MAG: TonB-dependent receptor, partial [Bdellovibrionales bacterium]|nr:TonB-dependent receptor [Bdellovibrionales bacterium]
TPILISPDMIERIEVVRGTGSVLHGSRAIGGVVNIITKKEGYHPIQGTVSSSFDSSTEGYQLFGSTYGLIKDVVGYRLSGSFADHGDRDTPAGRLEDTSFENNSWSGLLSKDWEHHRVVLSYEDYNSASEVYVEPAVKTTPPFTDFRIDAPQRDRRKMAVFYDGEDYSETLTDIHFDGYYQEGQREFNTFSDLLINTGVASIPSSTAILTSSELDTIGFNGLSTWKLSSENSLLFGFETKEDELDQDRIRTVTTAGVGRPPEMVVEGATQRSFELFTEDLWQVADEWEFRAGVRGIWFDTQLDNSSREGVSLSDRSDSHIVGASGLSYTGFENMTLWTGWSQGFVYPTMINLSTGAFAGPDFVNGDPQLDPETSNSVDIGFRYNDEVWASELSAFHTWADDYIDHVLCSSVGATCLGISGDRERIYANVDKAQTFGAEWDSSYTTGMFSPYARFGWVRRRYESGEGSTYNTGLPPVTTRMGVEVEGKVGPDVRAWGDLFIRAASGADEIGRSGSIEHDGGWTTLNIAAGLKYGEKQQYRLSAELLNLLNKEYTPATENLMAAERSMMLKASADF